VHRLFPYLFAVYPVLFIAVTNPGEAPMATVFTAATVIAATTALAVTALKIVLKEWWRAALGCTVLICLFYAYGPVHARLYDASVDAVNQITGVGFYLERLSGRLHPVISVIWCVIAVLALRGLKRMPPWWSPLITRGANTTAIVLMGFLAIQWIVHYSHGAGAREFSEYDAAQVTTGHRESDPDIYMIVLDGYGRADVLGRHYGFDNSRFLNDLSARGFRIAAKNNANYAWTFLSLASTLNMEYAQSLLGDRISPTVESVAPVYEKIKDNAVSRFLRQRGYEIVHFQSTWGATLQNPYADRQVPCHRSIFVNEFYRTIAEASWLKALNSKTSADLADCYLSHLQNLARMGGDPGPKFVFAHFVPPHHPYLFDSDGGVRRNANLSNQFQYQLMLWEDKGKYLEQLAYMNKRIIGVIDGIVATSARPPVIIVQSDHGPNLTAGLGSEDRVRIRMANLWALKLPDAPHTLIPDNGSPVNQFRYIFNQYFNANVPILPNRHYFSEYASPYRFVDVTATIGR